MKQFVLKYLHFVSVFCFFSAHSYGSFNQDAATNLLSLNFSTIKHRAFTRQSYALALCTAATAYFAPQVAKRCGYHPVLALMAASLFFKISCDGYSTYHVTCHKIEDLEHLQWLHIAFLGLLTMHNNNIYPTCNHEHDYIIYELTGYTLEMMEDLILQQENNAYAHIDLLCNRATCFDKYADDYCFLKQNITMTELIALAQKNIGLHDALTYAVHNQTNDFAQAIKPLCYEINVLIEKYTNSL